MTSTNAGTDAETARRPGYWIWPYRASSSVSRGLLQQAESLGRLFDRPWRWTLTAIAVGAVPPLLAFATGFQLAHILTAVFLVPLLAAAAVRDSTRQAVGVLTLALVAQCAVNITLAANCPERLSVVLPAGERYWHESRDWIETGVNPEYELNSWLTAHVRLFGGVTLLTYCSFGLIPLWRGLEQVDMMNFYVGRLIANSESPWVAGFFGWHPWSVCRGLGSMILLFELISFSFERLTGRKLSTARKRLARWGAGIVFFLLDGVIKYNYMESVRAILADNLSA